MILYIIEKVPDFLGFLMEQYNEDLVRADKATTDLGVGNGLRMLVLYIKLKQLANLKV
jgi:hypothetical protein